MPNEKSQTDASAHECRTVTGLVMKRWLFTNDLLAGVLLVSLPVMIMLFGLDGLITAGNVPELLLISYIVVTGTAAVWAFGVEAVKAWRDSGE